MNEYTNKKEVVTILERLRDCCGNGDMAFALNWAAETVKNMSAADVEEVRHGKIVETGRRYPYCSVCNTSLERSYFRYCPYCGAKMDKEKGK